ncbi:MAG: type II toxin-antitoxin system VapC family toxin [Thermoanaerobaculia bacterium]|nr:type II toxin-antitoxin system VapC family toxin [Thermoanaerobaculia bacterium]
MNLVDSCGWLEFLADGPNAGFFARPLGEPEKLLVPTICLLEVFKRTLQQRGEEAALEVAGLMQQGRVVDLDTAIALHAADLGVERKLSLADAVILATARAHDATVWTQDAHFEGLAGVRYRAAGSR